VEAELQRAVARAERAEDALRAMQCLHMETGARRRQRRDFVRLVGVPM
jgi:hypothetical protein